MPVPQIECRIRYIKELARSVLSGPRYACQYNYGSVYLFSYKYACNVCIISNVTNVRRTLTIMYST